MPSNSDRTKLVDGKQPVQRSFAKRYWYAFLHVWCRLFFTVAYRIRVRGRHYEPREGGVLVLSNHQSHFDPMLVGLSCQRRLNFLARDTLFAFAPFRWLIRSLDAIPIDREGSGLSGLKETLRRLKRGEMVLVFPEGTRTRDGKVARLKPGFVALARRGRVPLLPLAIEGAYEAWPRRRSLPGLSQIQIQFGPPISIDEVKQLSDSELIAEVERRIRRCHMAAHMALEGGRCLGRAASRKT